MSDSSYLAPCGTSWVVYPENTNYAVSEYGDVTSFINKRLLSQWPTTDGYLRTKISGKSCKIHDLVARCFLGPKPEGLQVNHIDGDKENNHYSNLEYVTHRDNLYHAMESGLHACSFRDTVLIDPSGNKHKVRNVAEFCRQNNLQQPNIHKVLNGLRKHHKGWTGYYEDIID